MTWSFIYLFEGATGAQDMEEAQQATQAHDLSMDMSAAVWIVSIMEILGACANVSEGAQPC